MRNSAVTFLFETVRKHPRKVFLSGNKDDLRFDQFFFKAFLLAEILHKDSGINRPILTYLPKTASALVAFAAILMSGNYYVPLDIKSPKKRLKQIIKQFDHYKIVSGKEFLNDLRELSVSNHKVICVEDSELSEPYARPSLDAMIEKTQLITNQIIDLDPCYIMYTSGSTGIPKGVVIPHRGVIDYIEWAISLLGVDENEIIGNQAPFLFDNSTLDIYLSWATGAKLCLIPEETFLFPVDIIRFLEEHKVTFVFFVPSVLVNISKLKLLSPGSLSSLSKIVFAGEPIPSKHLAYWQENLPGRTFINLYGPTEITVDCTYFIVDRIYLPHETLPIGLPRLNSGILILNEQGIPVSSGEKGELCVRGSSLALGYWKDNEKTRQAFIQNPVQNNFRDLIYHTGDICYKNQKKEIIFVGRKDTQIKHRGYRIELGEIETATKALQDIDDCCAFYNEENQEIYLFYEGKIELSPTEFRTLLSEQLPEYMIPRKFMRVDFLPRTPNGKIDRAALIKEL